MTCERISIYYYLLLVGWLCFYFHFSAMSALIWGRQSSNVIRIIIESGEIWYVLYQRK